MINMKTDFHTSELKSEVKSLKAGSKIYLSGEVYTARDAAHKRLIQMISNGEELPIPIKGSVLYYAGPTPCDSRPVGACGPTTSSRMDSFTPKLLSMGLTAMIGKGERSEEVVKAICKYNAVYFCAIGGAGALASKHIVGCEEVAFKELGCEGIRRLELDRFPLYVGIDCFGGSIFERGSRA